MASTYGWSISKVRTELTDEQLIHVYLEPHRERAERAARSTFNNAVESVRLGTVFAQSTKAYRRWSSQQATKVKRRPLSDTALEHAVMRIAGLFPGQVIRETA